MEYITKAPFYFPILFINIIFKKPTIEYWSFFFLIYFIEVQVIYNAVLVSGV